MREIIERLRALEAQNGVRKTIARYMALCDVPGRVLEGESLAALFCDDAVWEGIGPQYADKFGRLSGPREIVTMLQRYLPPTPHFTSNTHFLTSENIDVTGESAMGRWIMLQASSYVDGQAELISARLEVDFTRSPHDETIWLIRHFRTERLFDAPWNVNPAQGASV